jgi:hypothetical protein
MVRAIILLFVHKHAVHIFSAINIKKMLQAEQFYGSVQKTRTQNKRLFLREQSEIETPLQGASFES